MFKLPPIKKPDLSLVLLLLVGAALLFLLTFELWVSHRRIH